MRSHRFWSPTHIQPPKSKYETFRTPLEILPSSFFPLNMFVSKMPVEKDLKSPARDGIALEAAVWNFVRRLPFFVALVSERRYRKKVDIGASSSLTIKQE